MVMEGSVMHPAVDSHSPGGDAPAQPGGSNVYLVGLEFVRQYYTVLNQGPLYLHRFYSDDSSFVHGASARDSKVAYGQQEIHKRIQALNFHNCHAKIRQVDSHETLGNGVVIQVTGELSNNGQPMRRFMQTFVLAPQSPKRYYVRNDIFHYQDEVFCEPEGEEESNGEQGMESEEGEVDGVGVEMNGGAEIIPRDMPAVTEVSVKMSPPPAQGPAATSSPIKEETSPPAPEPEPIVTVSAEGPGVVHTVEVTPEEPQKESVSVAKEEEVPSVSVPKTFANLFKNPGAPTKPQPPPQARPPPPRNANNGDGLGNSLGNDNTSPPQTSPQGNNGGPKGLPPKPRMSGPTGPGGYPRGDNSQRDRRERLTSRSSTTLNDDAGSVDGERRRPVHTYPDANQLFVGNLPHFVTQQDMKEIFQQFGEVAEVKIQKPTPKSGGAKVPYFCFVVFEDPASAQAAIEKKNEIFMKINGGVQRRLNVEQKRSQRSSRVDSGDHEGGGGYNRMDSSSPGGGGRPSEGGGRGSRTFRGSRPGPGGEREQYGQGGGGRGGGMNQRGRGGGGGHVNKAPNGRQ